MGNIKKYNGDSWDVIATNNSRNIVVDDFSVNNSEKTSLNNILTKHDNDIDLLKKNVAWLALHGGGGSGGSGGGINSSEATCKIMVNGYEQGGVDTIKISKDQTVTITFSNFSSNARNSWRVVISLDGKTIKNSYVSINNSSIILKYEDITKNINGLNSTIVISAYYTDEVKGVYGSSVYSSNIFVNTCDLSVDKTISVNINVIDNTTIKYRYNVPISGEYVFKAIIKKDGELINEFTDDLTLASLKDDFTYTLLDLLPFLQNESVNYGNYNIISSLTLKIDETLYGVINHDIVIITEEIMISAPTMSLNSENPYKISKNGSLYCEYIALVYNISSFNSIYYVEYNGNYELIATTYNHKFGETVKDFIPLNKESWGGVTEEGESLKVKLVINTSSNKTAEIFFYYKIVNDNGNYISFRDDTILNTIISFDATTTGDREYIYQLNNNSNSNEITIKNGNILSKWQADINTHQPYLRISNGAYGVLGEKFSIKRINGSIDTQLLDYFIADRMSTTNGYLLRCSFTISICFKQDFHSDDDRTVFAFSHVNDDNSIADGICINTHGVYINKILAFPIVDNLLNNIVITCDFDRDKNSHKIKAYLNGVLTYVSYDIDYLFSSSYEFLPRITFGGLCKFSSNGEIEESVNLCDINLYYFNINEKPLNEFDIMIDYLNNLARCNYTESYTPNFSLLSEEIQRNFCEQGSGNSITNCAIYNINSDIFDFNSFFEIDANGYHVLNGAWINDRKEYIGIPIIYFDCSSTQKWSFKNFISNASTDPNTLTLDNVTVQYIDTSQINSNVLKITGCTISPQGTSTMADKIKNLNIEVPSNTMFMPIQEWLPEQIYTLKADIVDSSHSNNASIGKFINNVLGGDFLPIDDNARDNIKETYFFKNQCSEEVRGKLKVKITVEGFPVLLFIKFYGDDNPTALGVYSFNLGRDSVRNLGFEKLEKVIDKNGDDVSVDTFPCLFEQVTYNTNDTNTGYWVESKATNSIANFESLENNSVDSLSKLNTSNCEFWQTNDDIINNLFETRYPKSGKKPSEIVGFKNFIDYVVKLPIENRYRTTINGGVSMSDISGSFDAYKYDGVVNVKDGDNKHVMVSNVNDILTPDSYFNVRSSYGYFVVALLFGLVDNFGKNLTFRSWNIPNTTEFGEYYFGFYDLDTALGGTNQGALTINPFISLKEIYNEKQNYDDDFGLASETFLTNKGINCTTISARHNKLWLSLDTKFMRKKIVDTDKTSLYSTYWFNLRAILDGYVKEFNEKNNTTYDNFYTFFMEEYHKKQLEKCGVLLMNYDYKVKYLLDIRNDGETSTDPVTLAKLHGKKYEYCYNWFKEHILAMDSYFYWRDSEGLQSTIKNSDAEVNNDINNKVYITPSYIPLETNSTVIMHGAIGDSYKYFCFMPKNIMTNLPMGSNNSNSVVNWYMSHYNYVTKIGDENITLKDISINLFGGEGDGYCSLTDLNLSNCTYLSNSFSMLGFERKELSELRKIDFSFAKCYNLGTTFSLKLQDINNNTKYKKLTHINIQNSECISDITIPSVPLNELIVKNSKITSFNLIGQNYITNIDLTGCNKIERVVFKDCEQYGDIDLTSLVNLQNIEITNCPSVYNISINGCVNLSKIIIENCENVSSITINNCVKLSKDVIIAGCKKIKQIDISNNEKLESISIHLEEGEGGLESINKFYVKNTPLSSITNNYGSGLSNGWKEDGIDCRYFSKDIDVDFYNNQKVKYVHFLNDIDNPILLKGSFYNCFELERVYGHIKIQNYMPSTDNERGTFRNCYKFSIHGQLTSDTVFKDKKVLNGEKIKTVWQIILENHNESGDPKNSSYIKNYNNGELYKNEVFQTGDCVTNMYVVNNNNLYYVFRNTLITQFDIYYFLTTFGLMYSGDNLCNFVYTFACSKNPSLNYIPNDTFNWEKGNQIDRYAFYKCDKIGTLNSTFINTEQGGDFSFIYSPQTIDEEFKDNGVFSPLVNLSTISNLFTKGAVCSREVFFVSSEDEEKSRTKKFSLTEYAWVHIFASENFVYKEQNYDITKYVDFNEFKNNLSNFIKEDYDKLKKVYGNLTNMFMPFKKFGISNLYHFMENSSFIDYDTIKFYCNDSNETLINALCRSFKSTYGCGKINLNNIFESESDIVRICSSFNVSSSFVDSKTSNTIRVVVELDNNYFDKTPNLQYFGQNDKYPGNTVNDYVINGDGVKKIISGDKFPYSILSKLSNLVICKALFKDAECVVNDTLSLPNNLFENCEHLRNVSYMFYNFKKNYNLTSMSFANCPNISNLNYAFAIKTHNESYGPTGCIPTKFLYHGHIMNTKKIIGSYDDNKPGETICVISNSESNLYEVIVFDESFSATSKSDLLSNVRTKYGENYTVQLDNNNLILNKKTIEGGEELSVEYPTYNTSIQEMNYLFEKCISLTPYEFNGTENDFEKSKSYNPFKWYVENNKWVENSNLDYNSKEFDARWVYDGSNNEIDFTNVICEDTGREQITDDSECSYSNTEHTLRYFCAPDLLRYCSNVSSLGIEGVFAYCGSDYNPTTGGLYGDINSSKPYKNRGLTGTIPSYLLMPVSSVTNLRKFFKFCRHLSSYKKDGSIYLIPQDFFSYAKNVNNLFATFQGMGFVNNTTISVFNYLNNLLDIRKIFSNSEFGGAINNNWELSGIFTNCKKITKVDGAFSICDLQETESNNTITLTLPNTAYRYPSSYDAKITLKNIFNKNIQINKNNVKCVFYGWTYDTQAYDEIILNQNNNYGTSV